MKWISCDDELPTFNERVICATSKGVKILAMSPPSGEYKRKSDWCGEVVSNVIQRFDIDFVTHWMSLPEFPKAKFFATYQTG